MRNLVTEFRLVLFLSPVYVLGSMTWRGDSPGTAPLEAGCGAGPAALGREWTGAGPCRAERGV
jgi:hypothetical protein